jgi:hypothetical protein
MVSSIRERLHPRRSLAPLGVAFLLGLAVHAVDQLQHVRAGPVPILLTAPVVATLGYLHSRPDTGWKRLVVLLAWGFVGSGLAILGTYTTTGSYQLPRLLTDSELVLVDLGLFLWFVLVLTAGYVLGARTDSRWSIAALLAAPAVQSTFGFVLIALLEASVPG